ncbi:MAG: HU family DNA-binding protein [Paludibacteraceae bacterium]|nr:HU family DNA-binding protein [Paludibacteraceae bacterium]
MNNKEFLSEIATRLSISQKDCSNLMESLIGSVVTEFENGNSVSLQGFGMFEVRKKEQRLSVNPKTKQKMMVPPKLVLSFKSSNTYKEKLKSL